MNTDSKEKIANVDGSRLATAEQRLRQLGIELPAPPEPFGIYAEAVQFGSYRKREHQTLSFTTMRLCVEAQEIFSCAASDCPQSLASAGAFGHDVYPFSHNG